MTWCQDLELILWQKKINKERDFNQVKLPQDNLAIFWEQQLANTEINKSSLGTTLNWFFFFKICWIHTNATNLGSIIKNTVPTRERHVFQGKAKWSKNYLEKSVALRCHVLLQLTWFTCLHDLPYEICKTSDSSTFFIIPQSKTSHSLISFTLLSVQINSLSSILRFFKSRTNCSFTLLRKVLSKFGGVTPTHLRAICSMSHLLYPGVTA